MLAASRIGAITCAAVLIAGLSAAHAFEDAKYPDLSGMWLGVRLGVGGQPGFDPTKPWGLGQQAPLTRATGGPAPIVCRPACPP